MEQEDVGAALLLVEAPPTPLLMAQIITAMEAVLQGLRRLQARGAVLGSTIFMGTRWSSKAAASSSSSP
jgi:phosphatidylglycerophosphate synthase